jgi:hypothetical protein
MKRLDLTPERQKIIRDTAAEFLQAGLSTESADFDAAEEAIAGLYASIDMKRPYFVRLSSPVGAELYLNLLCKTWPAMLEGKGQLWDQLRDQLRGQLWDQLRGQLRELGGQLWDQLGGQIRGQLRGQLRDQQLRYMGTWFWGQQDYYWAWLEGGQRVGAVYRDDARAKLALHTIVMKSCGWWYPFRDFCIVTDRPETIARDPESRLHGETGPALRYRDGWSIHAWHGTRVPARWIEDKPSLTAKTALTWENIEQRRAACEILGWAAVLRELNARTIDKDQDPEIGELLEVDIPDVGREKFLKVRCGTGREFALPVPPDMRTALQANGWTYGFDVGEFTPPEVRT